MGSKLQANKMRKSQHKTVKTTATGGMGWNPESTDAKSRRLPIRDKQDTLLGS